MNRFGTLIFVAILMSSLASAQDAKPGGMLIQTPTRQVTLFSRLESELNQAISRHDKEKLAAMLTDDFEARTPNLAGDPIPRQDWLAKVVSGEVPAGFRAGRMAVRSFSDTAVVDFVEQQGGKPRSGERFVVDVWKGSGDSWQLAVRYMSEVNASAAPKPTGKQ